MGTAAAEVELLAVTKRFADVTAVDDVSLEIRRGEFLSLLGPSGCGKTTTLRLVAGFEQPDAGSILIGGRDVTGVAAYRRPVNTVFQSYALFPHLSVLDNVAYGLKQRRVPRRERRRRAEEGLELVRLPGLAKRRPRELSGGQQQRVALARALVMSPQVLLLDEPLGALDLKVRKSLQIELKRIQESVGITFVYVTHDQEEALSMSDRVAVMKDGRIEQLATPREIYDRPATHFVAEFIGDTNFIELGESTVAVRPERLSLARSKNADQNDGSSTGRDGRVRDEDAGSANRRPIGATEDEGSRRPARFVDTALRSDARSLGGLPGRVVAAMVIGPAVQCVVRLDDGQEVVVRTQRSGETLAESLQEGERVSVSWAEGEALSLQEEGTR